MTGFAEKLRLLEQRKKEYRQRLAALPPDKQKAVEDEVWDNAAQLSTSIGVRTANRPEVRATQSGLMEAFNTVRNLDKNEEITPYLMTELHRMILWDEDPWHAGQYRRAAARWTGSTMIMTNWANIPSLVNKLCDNMNNNADMSFYKDERKNPQLNALAHNPVIRAIEGCYNTIITHPFTDANKRVARAGMALVLSRANHIPMTVSNKKEFVAGVESYFHTHQPHNFIRTMLKQMDESYNDAFHALRKQERGGR